MFWLKTYPTEHQTPGTFKVGEKTVQNNVWKYIQAIQVLKGMKVGVPTCCRNWIIEHFEHYKYWHIVNLCILIDQLLFDLYLDSFHCRYYSLKDKTGKDLAKTNSDSGALAHDHLIHPMGLETSKGCGYPWWQGSDAECLLKQDIDTGLHETLKPNAHHQSQPEYKDFPLAVFHDHIHH
jgi:hypothetical protein